LGWGGSARRGRKEKKAQGRTAKELTRGFWGLEGGKRKKRGNPLVPEFNTSPPGGEGIEGVSPKEDKRTDKHEEQKKVGLNKRKEGRVDIRGEVRTISREVVCSTVA